MDSALKQRLVGATVLVALGVIFIPMLLERGSEDSRLSVRMEIPPKPEFSNQKTVLDNPPKIEPIETPQPIDQAIEQAKPKKSEEKSDSASGGGEIAASVETMPKNPVSKNKTAGDQWIVQVGSFSRQANAEVLRDKLKKDGFAAYMESARTVAGSVYRVRIGPIEQRAQAENLADKLLKKGNYRAIVLADD